MSCKIIGAIDEVSECHFQLSNLGHNLWMLMSRRGGGAASGRAQSWKITHYLVNKGISKIEHLRYTSSELINNI